MFLIIHLVVTSYMMGLCWFVQLTHYPFFTNLTENQIKELDKKHFNPTVLATFPPMLFELVTGILLLFQFDFYLISWVNITSIIIIWISTFLIQIPLHLKIIEKSNKSYIYVLIKTNWVRTILWTLRVLGIIGWVELEILA